MGNKTQFTIALIAFPDELRLEFEVLLEKVKKTFFPLGENLKDIFEVTVIYPISPSKVSFFPHEMDVAIIKDIIIAQQVMLACQADLVIYYNEVDKEIPYMLDLFDTFYHSTGTMIIWDTSNTEEDEKLEPGKLPGAVLMKKNSMKEVVTSSLFILLNHENQLL